MNTNVCSWIWRTVIGQSMQQRRGFTETNPQFQTLQCVLASSFAERNYIILAALEARLPICNWKMTYPQTLLRDSGNGVSELGQAMRDRTLWHAVVAGIPASDAEGWWWGWQGECSHKLLSESRPSLRDGHHTWAIDCQTICFRMGTKQTQRKSWKRFCTEIAEKMWRCVKACLLAPHQHPGKEEVQKNTNKFEKGERLESSFNFHHAY